MNYRQEKIIEFLSAETNAQTQDIQDYLAKNMGEEFSRMTIIRDMEELLSQELAARKGSGRSAAYEITAKGRILAPMSDYQEYFQKDPDQRIKNGKIFQEEVFQSIKFLFSQDELEELDEINDGYKKRIASLSAGALRKEFERLTIELSWKSSRLEGNTYSLVDTEILLTEKKEAEGHKKEEATMLLNHKRALEYVYQNQAKFQNLTLRDIEDVHSLLTENLGISKGLRKNLVGITGTAYKPLDNEYQIKEVMEKMISAVNRLEHPLEKAIAFILLVSYIQPFEDGNKRTARIVANAILLAHDYCPLSYRSVDEAEYKKAALLFYERNSAWLFKRLFVEQFKFAAKSYFQA
jgi:fido (protein-threonine AMPylation protein)/predicted transcriptional regulator